MQSFGEAVMFLDQPYPVLGEALSDTLLLHIGAGAVSDTSRQGWLRRGLNEVSPL